MRRARVKAVATVPVRRKALNETSLERDVENPSSNNNSGSNQDSYLSETNSQDQNTCQFETNQISTVNNECLRIDTPEVTSVKSENITAPKSEDVAKEVEVTTSPSINRITTINVLKKGKFSSLPYQVNYYYNFLFISFFLNTRIS